MSLPHRITIAPQALEAGQNNVALMLYGEPYEGLAGAKQDVCKNIAYGAFEAMVAAWEGMVNHPGDAASPQCIWLPLPTENTDAEA